MEELFAVTLGTRDVALNVEKLVVGGLVTVVATGEVVVDTDINPVLVLFTLICGLEVAEYEPEPVGPTLEVALESGYGADTEDGGSGARTTRTFYPGEALHY